MKSSASFPRHLIALALVTIFFTNSIVLSASAVGRSASATHNLQPAPSPPPTPTNGKIAFSRVDSNYTLNGVYLIDPDGSNEVKVPYTEFDSTPVWSPNGLRLAVVHLANSHPGNVSGWGIEVMNADGSGRVRFNDNVEPYERIVWSPDGTKIAYTSYGQLGANADIMVMDANTGADIANLTNDPAYDYLPSWSPDGTKIVFTSNRSGGTMDVFVMNADGSNQQNITNYYANDYYPSWSPDGSKIVFVSSGRGGTFDNDEICVMNPDGTNVMNLTLNQVPDIMPAWSPDGTRIVFNSDRNGNRDLYSMDANGSNETRVTVHTAEDSRASWQLLPVSTPTPTPTPSPTPRLNGNIAFTRVGPPAEQIATINEDGSNLTVLTSGSNAEDPEFSPDGTRIAFSSVNSGQFQIWLMNSDGSGQTRLTNNNLRGDDEPTWSPDGSKIAFVGGAQIWVINADGTNEINLSGARTGDNYPDWSPDGSKIAFTKDYSSPNAQTFVMNADGSNLVNLSNTVVYGAERDPAWSPDGSKIAYQSLQDGPYEIYVMNADGSGETRLTTTGYPVSNTEPDWSPDGSKIVFSSTRDNDEQEIYVMNADGTGQTRLTNDPVNDEHPSWGSYVAAPPTPTPTPTPTQADLVATADAQPYQVEPGGTLVFNNAVTNNGPSLANNVNVDVYVPPYTQLDSYTAPGGTCQTTTYPNDAGHQVLCSFGDLGVGDVRTVTVNVTITAIDGASMQAITTVSGSTLDPNSANNTAYAPLIVRAAPTPTPTPETGAVKIAFVSERDGNQEIYVMNADGSGQTNISNNAIPSWSADSDPAWSPDGSKIAFQSNRDAYSGLYVMNADGTNVVNIPGVSGTNPAWSPGGTQLVFMSNLDIYRVNVDGTNLIRLTTSVNNTKPSWSPDGNYLAFETWRDGGSEIYVMGQDGGNPTRLTNTPGIGAYDPAWSPNGLRIAYHSFNVNNFDIFTMDAQGGLNQMRITSDVAEDFGAAWSPDGSKILFTSDRDGNQEIYVCDWDGANPTRLTNVSARDYSPAAQLIVVATPTPTPTPTPGPPPVAIGKVAFQTNRDGNTEIYVMEPDGSNQINVSNSTGEDYQPVWSPDGSKIAFQSQRDGNPELYVVNPDGSNLVRLTNDAGEDSNPSWSPDGSKITFASSRATGGNEVFVMNADGSNPTRLTFGSDNSNSSDLPRWSPDGTRIAYQHQIYSQSGGTATAQYEVYVMNADGSNQVNLTNSPENEGGQSWSPDSASLLFSQNEEVFVIPSTGGTPVNITNGPGSIDRLPQWAPNGERIVFVSDRYDTNEIFTVTPNGSGLLRLTDNSGQPFDKWDYLPSYTTTGSAIAFTRFGDGQTEVGNTEIYLMTIEGLSQTNLTNNPAEDTDFAWQPIPPTPPTADVYINAYASPLYVPNGGQVTYNIVVGSFGPYPVSNITLTGQFPAGVTFVSADTASGSCTGTPGDSTFNCTITDTINSYESRQVTVTATATGAPYTPINTNFEVTSAYDNNSNNNSMVAQFYIASPPLPGPTPGPVDEAQLAYGKFDSNAGQWDIFVQRADGAGLLNLTNHPASEYQYTWSPNGSRLAFLRFDYANSTVSLCTVNADGSNLAVLTNAPNEYIDSFAWSPDSNRLTFNGRAYISEGPQTSEIFVVNADGTGRASVSGATGENNSDPKWSPAGTSISYIGASLYYPPTNDIYVSNPDGTNRIKISNSDTDSDGEVDWSPDGARLAFTRSPQDGIANIYTVRADGSDLRQLTNDPVNAATGAPHWSPDGSKLSFVSYSIDGLAHEVMNADGTGRLVIFNPPANSFSTNSSEEWSPDGTRLIFDFGFGESSGGNSCIVNVDGTGLQCLGNELDTNTAPDWSPDGTRIAFLSLRNGEQSIDIINADGTGRVELTQGNVLPPKWRPRPQGNTPAGTNVAVTQNGATVIFSNVTQAGQTTITPIDPNSLQGIPGEYVINANSLAFEITTTATYTGPITIGFQVPGVNNPITFSTLRVLHGEPPPVPNFVDRTILAPDSPTHDFPARTIYARVTSLSPFVIAEKPPNQLTALGPAQVWIGLKNSDDVGTRFDLLAEVFKNGSLIGSGQVNNVAGGSSGFNNAKLNAINLALSGTPSFGAGSALSIRLSVRVTASGGHRSGTARLWFNDEAANSRFSATIGGVTKNYYLRKLSNSLVLTTATGSTPKVTIDVFVDRAVGGNPFKPFGTWAIAF